MSTNKNHPFHLVDYSPWPIISALNIMSMMMGTIKWFNSTSSSLMMIAFLSTIISSYQWWRDVVRESAFQGLHTISVMKSMKWGMLLFITSEVFFFISFFWMFFHSSLSPGFELGLIWPPKNIETFNPFQIPLLNTMILLTSGISVTWAHNSILNKNFSQSKNALIYTLLLGVYFTLIQIYEYKNAQFSIADSIYGSSFFIATGFHGIHVLIGSLFLFTCLKRMMKFQLSSYHHFGFEAAAWYWHFVDVVWLFLFISIYWWGK